MKTSSNIRGILFLLLAVLIGSLQSVAVKWIGGNYSVLEIVTLRSLVALPLTLLFFRFEGGMGLPITKQPKLEYVRGIFLFFSYTTYMMGLAALPLADVESIRFSGPLMITILSVLMLREKVEPRHWLALIVGFMGVLLIVRPGSANFNEGTLFILISVLFYALNAIFTRRLRGTDSSATMAYFSTWVYLGATLVVSPLAAAVGETPGAHPSTAFLFHAWTLPALLDLTIMFGLGFVWAAWMYFMTRAYSVAQASVVAPFEYASLPINIMWGFIIWHELPTVMTVAGAVLTLLSGMYILYQDRQERSIVDKSALDNASLEKNA
ncbi:MAG TPA: DMT family transporter [Anaerolineales bacterium]|nr:DMT family transporter [Anaerolineales bacterium]